MRVAVLRDHPRAHERLVSALATQAIELHDVCSTDRLTRGFVALTPDRHVDLALDGLPVTLYDLILFFGVPRIATIARMTNDACRFASQEWHAFVASALALTDTKVLGLPPLAHASVTGRYGGMSLLETAGWIAKSAEGALARDPAPLTNERSRGAFDVVFTRKRWILMDEDVVTFEHRNRLEELCWRTWSLLLPHRQPCSSLRFDADGDQFEAHELLHALPEHAPERLARDVAVDLLF